MSRVEPYLTPSPPPTRLLLPPSPSNFPPPPLLSSIFKSASQAVLSKMQLTLHETPRPPHGPSRLVQAMSAWSVKTRNAHCRDARVYTIWSHYYGHAQTKFTPPPPPLPLSLPLLSSHPPPFALTPPPFPFRCPRQISLVKTPSEVYPTEENKSVICFSDAETSAIVRKLSSGNSKRSWLGMLSKIRWGMKNERAG